MKDLEGLMNERDVVGAQLVRRNDEISLLYEKIRILEVTLQRGVYSFYMSFLRSFTLHENGFENLHSQFLTF